MKIIKICTKFGLVLELGAKKEQIAEGAHTKSRACPRKGVDGVTTWERDRVILSPREIAGDAWDIFSNLFNLGTRCVSESYLRGYEIKQSDKQSPSSREEPKLARLTRVAFPSLYLSALWCVRSASNTCHTRSVYEANLLLLLPAKTRALPYHLSTLLYTPAPTLLCAPGRFLWYSAPLFFNRRKYAIILFLVHFHKIIN